MSSPIGLAFDSKGNLYAANFGDSTIEKFNSSGVGTLFASGAGLVGPAGLAFDGSGNLYAANFNGNTIEEFNSSGTGTLFANSGLSTPVFIAIFPVPEPSTLLLVLLGLASLGCVPRRKRK